MSAPAKVWDAYLEEFERCVPFIQRAVDRVGGEFTIDHVRHEIMSNQAQLHSRESSAVVTRIETTPSGKTFVLCWLAGGIEPEILDLEKSIEQWGKSLGCTQIKIIGRAGFLRTLPGYSEQARILAKELTHEL
ncbi:hypothetical protein [Maritalea porphyrae]|uniref:hypothetical protein n=1 Tax=Maritalea porphyrae TaxID=880732 RepID=UPI0022B05DCC|nr:hypothetical protein [Maritalea porphyrae]MCZ4270889.1 hypothetical protein [Maritalea porphyrae]